MKKIIFLACTFLMLITACNDEQFFTLQRPVESPWQSLSEFERAPIGAYKYLFSRGDWGNLYNYWYLFKNAIGDDADWSTPGDNGWGW